MHNTYSAPLKKENIGSSRTIFVNKAIISMFRMLMNIANLLPRQLHLRKSRIHKVGSYILGSKEYRIVVQYRLSLVSFPQLYSLLPIITRMVLACLVGKSIE